MSEKERTDTVESIANEMLARGRAGKPIPAGSLSQFGYRLKRAIKPKNARAVMFEDGHAVCYGDQG